MYPSMKASLVFFVVWLAVVVLNVVGGWKILTKAGRPGWGVVIPVYNLYLACKIAGRPGWWLVLLLVPAVNIAIGIVIAIDIAKAFSKGAGYGVALWFLSFIFIPILGLGSATYTPPTTAPRF